MQNRVTKPWALMLIAAGLLTACSSERNDPIEAHDPGSVMLLIEREGNEGPYIEGTAEHFKIIASDEVLSSVRWSASAGTLESDAERVTWTLPTAGTASLVVSVQTESGKEAESTFTFQVAAAALAPESEIDPSPDVTGATCELAFDNAGKRHVIYLNETHRTLWYGTWDGTTWRLEQIDGPGFGTEGYFIGKYALAIDPSTGTPHVAYHKAAVWSGTSPLYRIWYATRVNNAWTRELVDATNRMNPAPPSILLNPSQSMQPTIVFGDGLIRVAIRSGPNTWTSTATTFTVPNANGQNLIGHVAFDAAGTLYVPFMNTWSNGSAIYLGSIKSTGNEFFNSGLQYFDALSPLPSVVWGPSQHLLLLAPPSARYLGGLQDMTISSPLSASTSRTSQVDSQVDATDLAYAGKPYIVDRHGTNLELITTNAQNLWTYTQLGTVQTGSYPSVAVNPMTGTAHVCYQRDNKLRFQ